MFLLSAYLILCYVALSFDCYQLNKTLCEESSCFYLYDGDTTFVTGDKSYQACNKEGLEMLRIESNKTQTVVERLLHDLPSNTPRQVWIAGRRSNDNIWKFMNRTAFNNKDVNDPTSQTGLYCMYVTVCKSTGLQYQADNCDEKKSSARLLCQYDLSETDNCRSAEVPDGNKCYVMTQYNGSEPNKIDWYSGQTYCSQSDKQGDIAYSYLDNNTLINNIIDLVHPGADCAQLWLGVRRRIWFWKTDSTSDDIKAITYYNWENGTKVDSSDNNCIYIDVDQRYKWVPASCNNPSLKYFMCMKNNVCSTTITTTTKANTNRTGAHGSTTTTSPVITSIHTTGDGIGNISRGVSDSVGFSNTNDKPSLKPAYIIAIVVGVVLLAVVIGLAVFFILRERRKQTSTKQSKVEELQYDDVELDGDNDDVIDPYGVVGAENAEKVEVRHKKAPSGDLYAVSSKQVNKIDESKNEEYKNPEVVYAQPKKKKNQKTKNREENGSAKSGNDVDSEKPSGGETGTGSKHTEHFEAPSGEVYARIIKDGKDTDE